jgi:hypothetical protein
MTLIKYTPPSKYEIAPYGTTWQVEKSDKPLDYYIQISKDEQNPCWLPMGDFLVLVNQKHILEEKFINECLSKLSTNVSMVA